MRYLKLHLLFLYFISLIVWILFVLCRTILILVGYIVVPVAVLCRAYEKIDNDVSWRNNGDPIYRFTWPIMLPFNNPDDGFYCTTYFNHGFLLTSLRWTCVRNPANGLRTIPYLSCKVDPLKIRFIGSFVDYRHTPSDELLCSAYKDKLFKYDTKTPQWFFCWQDYYSCIFWQFYLGDGLYRFWIGFKLYPTDQYGVTAYRANGAGFATQLKRIN